MLEQWLCETVGSTQTCEVTSTSTSPISVIDNGNVIVMLAVILFCQLLVVCGLVFNTFYDKK